MKEVLQAMGFYYKQSSSGVISAPIWGGRGRAGAGLPSPPGVAQGTSLVSTPAATLGRAPRTPPLPPQKILCPRLESALTSSIPRPRGTQAGSESFALQWNNGNVRDQSIWGHVGRCWQHPLAPADHAGGLRGICPRDVGRGHGHCRTAGHGALAPAPRAHGSAGTLF